MAAFQWELHKLFEVTASTNTRKALKHFTVKPQTQALRRKELELKRQKAMLKHHLKCFMPNLPVRVPAPPVPSIKYNGTSSHIAVKPRTSKKRLKTKKSKPRISTKQSQTRDTGTPGFSQAQLEKFQMKEAEKYFDHVAPISTNKKKSTRRVRIVRFHSKTEIRTYNVTSASDTDTSETSRPNATYETRKCQTASNSDSETGSATECKSTQRLEIKSDGIHDSQEEEIKTWRKAISQMVIPQLQLVPETAKMAKIQSQTVANKSSILRQLALVPETGKTADIQNQTVANKSSILPKIASTPETVKSAKIQNQTVANKASILRQHAFVPETAKTAEIQNQTVANRSSILPKIASKPETVKTAEIRNQTVANKASISHQHAFVPETANMTAEIQNQTVAHKSSLVELPKTHESPPEVPILVEDAHDSWLNEEEGGETEADDYDYYKSTSWFQTRTKILRQTRLSLVTYEVSQFKLVLKMVREATPQYEECDTESEYDDIDGELLNQPRLEPVVIPSGQGLTKYHNRMFSPPVAAFLQKEMEAKADAVCIYGEEHLEAFLNFIKEKFQNSSTIVDRTYLHNIKTLTDQEYFMIRQMRQRKPRVLLIQDILDRFDEILNTLPVDPLKNLFFIHLKEFMRRFPARKYSTIPPPQIKIKPPQPKPSLMPIQNIPLETAEKRSRIFRFIARWKGKFYGRNQVKPDNDQ